MMHRQLLPHIRRIDHVNGDGLDNRRANLRPATAGQNQANRSRNTNGTSRFKGVAWFQKSQKWMAKITHNYKQIYLGCYHTEKEAAIAYNVAALELFGEYARLNNINGEES